MNHIRLATKEEVEKIKGQTDLTPETAIWALDNAAKEADLVAVRQIIEVDPFFPAASSNTAQRARFFWGLEERLMGSGIAAYYFSINDTPELAPWKRATETWGAEQVSTGPVFRMKKVLVKAQ